MKKFKVGAGLGLLGAAGAALVMLFFSSPKGQPFSMDLTVAPMVLDFDEGLDVRDAQGRPVASPAARNEMRQLFVGSLYALLMRPELPRVAEILALLKRTWNFPLAALRNAVAVVWASLVDLWSPGSKRADPAPFLLVLAFLVLLTPCVYQYTAGSPRTSSLLNCLSSVVIRC